MDAIYGAWPYPRRAAHRGGGWLAPENTLAAMRVGHANGFRMVELDAKLSGDGTLLVMHDDTVDRTTDGSGRVAGLTWGEIARLDAGGWHSAAFAGEPVPTLRAVARYCLANGIAVNIEIKPCPGRERETGAAAAIEARALWRGSAVPPLLSSFAEEALEAARHAAPELPRALLLHRIPADWRGRLEALACVALDAHHGALTAEVVAEAHRHRHRVLTYTPNDPARVAELESWGVDCVITDAVDAVGPGR